MEHIDCTGLTPEDVRLVKALLEFLKARGAKRQGDGREVEYSRWPLGVKGEITRKEIYDRF